MFGISVLQHALRAEQFLVVFTIKFDFLILVRLTHEHSAVLALASIGLDGCGGKGWESWLNGEIHRQILKDDMVGDLVEGALDHVMLVELLETLQAESVTTREGERLLLCLVVSFKADTAFKYWIHLIRLYLLYSLKISINKLIIKALGVFWPLPFSYNRQVWILNGDISNKSWLYDRNNQGRISL